MGIRSVALLLAIALNLATLEASGSRLPTCDSEQNHHRFRGIVSALDLTGEDVMGKYLLAWLLGVPVFVLVLVYLFF